jgi:hypothetical protein
MREKGKSGRGKSRRRCAACVWFEIRPCQPAVDPSGESHDEADGLCRVHRARMTEGYCVLCARRLPWMVIREGSDIGCCRACFVEWKGEAAARELEVFWEGQGRRASG